MFASDFPEKIKNAGVQSYVERNFYMIDRSDICVFYYNPDYKSPMKKLLNSSLKTVESSTW